MLNNELPSEILIRLLYILLGWQDKAHIYIFPRLTAYCKRSVEWSGSEKFELVIKMILIIELFWYFEPPMLLKDKLKHVNGIHIHEFYHRCITSQIIWFLWKWIPFRKRTYESQWMKKNNHEYFFSKKKTQYISSFPSNSDIFIRLRKNKLILIANAIFRANKNKISSQKLYFSSEKSFKNDHMDVHWFSSNFNAKINLKKSIAFNSNLLRRKNVQ